MPGLDKVEVDVAAVAGVCVLPLGGVLRLGRGARLLLETRADDSVEIRANGVTVGSGRLVAGRGERLALEVTALAHRVRPVASDPAIAAT